MNITALPMRSAIATGFFLATGALLAQAPDLVTLRDANNAVVNGGTIIVYGDPTDYTLERSLTAELTGVVPRSVNVLRYELNVVLGTQNYFAWGSNMFFPVYSGANPIWVGYDPLQMAAQQVGYFSAYYRPESSSDIGCFRFVWYDVNSPNDSSWVNICFDTETLTGVQEQVASPSSLSAYPNPVAGGDVTFIYDAVVGVGGMQLVLYNALGERAMVRSLSATNGRVAVPTGTLASGLWFAALEQNGRMVATRRLVVSH